MLVGHYTNPYRHRDTNTPRTLSIGFGPLHVGVSCVRLSHCQGESHGPALANKPPAILVIYIYIYIYPTNLFPAGWDSVGMDTNFSVGYSMQKRGQTFRHKVWSVPSSTIEVQRQTEPELDYPCSKHGYVDLCAVWCHPTCVGNLSKWCVDPVNPYWYERIILRESKATSSASGVPQLYRRL